MLLVLQISSVNCYYSVCMEPQQHSTTSSGSRLRSEFRFTLDRWKCISYADINSRPKIWGCILHSNKICGEPFALSSYV